MPTAGSLTDQLFVALAALQKWAASRKLQASSKKRLTFTG